MVNQLLTELDGLESRHSVFVIAATNRPDMVFDSFGNVIIYSFFNGLSLYVYVVHVVLHHSPASSKIVFSH